MMRSIVRGVCVTVAAWATMGRGTEVASAQTGACCFACLNCADGVSATDCAAWGGTYKGNGTTCASVVCDSTVGACCMTGDGYCNDCQTPANCAAAGGVYRGGGSTCAAITCDYDYGACCTVTGSCYETYRNQCLSTLDNEYRGDNTTCATANCTDRSGSCCYAGGCFEGNGPLYCQTYYNGTFSLGLTCVSSGCYGACCTVNGGCYETTQANCLSTPDQTFHGGGSSCASVSCPNVTGACCYSNGCVEGIGKVNCETNYGGSFSLGETCLSSGCYGACCTVSGSCFETTQDVCDSEPDQVFHGGGSTCASVTCTDMRGACCVDGSCNPSYGAEWCEAAGGEFSFGIDCSQASCPGACCLPNLSCVEQVSSSQCLNMGGTFGGSLSQCSSLLCTASCTNAATLVSSEYRIFPSSILIDDINKDGWFEVIFVAEDGSGGGGGGGGGGGMGLTNDEYPTCQSTNQVAGFGGLDSCGGGGGQRRVHVLNGASNYTSELPGWPIDIVGSPYTVTVSTGDINFDGYPDVMVGSGTQCRSFRFNGMPTPGWESVQSPFTFQNAFTIGDSNSDGAPDMICVDESTFYQRFQALGRKWQCQYVSDPVYSTAAIGDVGRKHLTLPRVADGIPDAVTCGEISLSTYNPIRVWNTFGVTIDCVLSPPGGFQDQLFQIDPPDYWFSSPALARLDRVNPASTPLDAAQDIVLVNADGWLRVYNSTAPSTPSEVLLGNGLNPRACNPHYSSPAIVDLNGDGLRQEIIVGSDDGRIYAFRYDASVANPALRLVPVAGWFGGILLDAGAAVSSSPIAADVLGDTKPEVIIANDAGKVYIIDWQGNTLSSWCCRPSGAAVTAASAIYSTPAVWVRRPTSAAGSATRKPMIFAGNRHGLWRIDLSSAPDFATARAYWPTFHKDNGRTGAWADYATAPKAGSIGGIVCSETDDTLCEIFHDDLLLDPVKDPQNSPAPYTFTSVSDGRFVFDMLKPDTYFVRFTDSNGSYVKKVPVTAGKMTFLKGCCPRLGTGASEGMPPARFARLIEVLQQIQERPSPEPGETLRSPEELVIEALQDIYAIDPYCVNN